MKMGSQLFSLEKMNRRVALQEMHRQRASQAQKFGVAREHLVRLSAKSAKEFDAACAPLRVRCSRSIGARFRFRALACCFALVAVAATYRTFGQEQRSAPAASQTRTESLNQAREFSSHAPARDNEATAQTANDQASETPNQPSADRKDANQKSAVYSLLDRAYKLLNEKRYAEAAPLLEQVTRLEPENAQTHKQLAYVYLDLERKREAITEFQIVERLQPDDFQTRLQLGYLYDSLQEKENALAEFRGALDSTDSEIRDKAQKAVNNLSAELANRAPSTFTEIYAAPFYQSRFNNFIAPAIARHGIIIESAHDVELYASFRFSRDARSTGGNLPQIFSDNAAIPAIGARLHPFKSDLTLYAEAGLAFNLTRSAISTARARSDYRAGLYYARQWGESHLDVAPESAIMPLKLHGEIYADASYYSRFHNNFISYLQARESLRFFQWRETALDAYARVNLAKDTHRDFFNNLGETIAGVRLTPWRPLGLSFDAEYVRGYYFGIERADEPNPYRPQYNDFRLSLVFNKRINHRSIE